MSNSKKPAVDTANDPNFFMFQPVPTDMRRATWKQILVWVGFGYVATGLFVGGQLAGVDGRPGLPFGDAVLAIALGMGTLLVLATFLGIMAQKTGMSLALLSRYSYGAIGANLPLLIMGTVVLGWFSSITGMVGDIWHQFLVGIGLNSDIIVFNPAWLGHETISPITLDIFILCIIFGLLFTFTSMYGIKGLEYVAIPVSPVILVIAVTAGVAFVNMLGEQGGLAAATANVSGLSFSAAVSMIIGSWISGAITGVDLFRYNKGPIAVFLGAAACFVLTNPLLNIVGYLGTITVGQPNYINWMLSLSVVFALIGAITWVLSLWTTNDAELYFNALYYGPVLRTFGFNPDRKKIVAVAGTIATLLGSIGFYHMYFANFINLLGTIAPPIAGPLLADFFIIKKMKYDIDAYDSQPRFNKVGIISLICGMLIGFFGNRFGLTSTFPMGVLALICTMIIYVLLYKIMKPNK